MTTDDRAADPNDVFVRMVAAFGHLLHSAGVPVTPERSTRFGSSIALARPATVDEVYWLGRITLLTGHDQVEIYDRVFRQVFEGIIDFADFRGDSNAAAPPASTPTGDRSPGDPERSGEAPLGSAGHQRDPRCDGGGGRRSRTTTPACWPR